MVPPASAQADAPPAPAPTEAAFQGELDTSFGQRGSTLFWQRSGEHEFKGVALGKDGAIYALGTAPFDSRRDMALVRFDSNGRIDDTFGKSGVARASQQGASGSALALDARGRAWCCGYIYGRGGGEFLISRVTPTGVLDTKFGNGGIVIHDSGRDDRAQAIHLLPSGRALVSGYHSRGKNQVLCLEESGAPCANYGEHGVAVVEPAGSSVAFATRSALHGNGIVLGGYLPDDHRMFVTRVTANGEVDPSFGRAGTTMVQGASVGAAWALAVDARERILIAGQSRSGPVVIARLDADGSLDTSFGNHGLVVPLGAMDQLYALMPLPSGRVLGAGFRNLGDDAVPLLMAINANGSMPRDPRTDDSAQRPTFVFDAALDAAGRVVAVGNSPRDRTRAWIARYR